MDDETRDVRPPGRTWWAVACLALGVFWLLLTGVPAVTGYLATSTVVSNGGDAECTVTWLDAYGWRQVGVSDCDDEAPGERLLILAPGWPSAGEDPGTPALEAAVILGVGVLLVGVGVLRLLVVARRRRRIDARFRHAGTDCSGEPALSVERTARAARWALRRAWAVVVLAAVSAVAWVGGAAVHVSADRELRETGVRTVGTVVGVDPGTRSEFGGVSVRWTAGDETRLDFVELDPYEYAEGQQVDVLYDPADADRMTIDDVTYGPGWVQALVPVAMTGTFVGGVLGARRLPARRRMRRLLSERSWRPVDVVAEDDDWSYSFTTPDGVVWDSSLRTRWGGPTEEADPGDPPIVQSAWWVSDGATAVFSSDQGAPLVLARRGGDPSVTTRRSRREADGKAGARGA